jgi:uncharacterized protein (DUF1330 family)
MTEAVYMMAQIDVKDLKVYIEEYGMPVFQQFTEAGAEVLVATPEAQVLEGEWSGNWTVIAKFPSAESASAFYNSEKYAPLKKARIEQLSNSGTIVMLPSLNVGS